MPSPNGTASREGYQVVLADTLDGAPIDTTAATITATATHHGRTGALTGTSSSARPHASNS